MSAFTPEELAERRNWLGASEVAALVGMTTHRTPMDLFLDKSGLLGDAPSDAGDGTDPASIGLLQEDTIAELYLRRMKNAGTLPEGCRLSLEKDGRTSVRRHIDVDGFAVPCSATPDRTVLLLDGEDAVAEWGLEMKSRGVRTMQGWGLSGSKDIPDDVWLQVQWSMGVCELDRWDVAALLGGNDFRVYSIDFDAEAFEMLLVAARKFWSDLVAGKHPDLDASAATKRYVELKRMATKDVDAVAPDTDAAQWVAELLHVRAERAALEVRQTTLENKLKDFIGTRGGVSCPYGQVTWFQNKDSQKVDYKAVVAALKVPEDVLAAHTTTVPGARVFRVKGADDE